MIPLLSIKERILIYLHDIFSENLSFPIDKEPPTTISSERITDALSIRKGTMVKPLKALIREGLVEKKRFYVRKTGRFRYFYFLTAKGIYEAKTIEEEIGKEQIKVRDKGKVKNIGITEVISYLRKIPKSAKTTQVEININYTSILRNISPTGFLDLRDILEPERFVDFTERAPEIKYFFGRENELKEISEFIKSKSKIFVIRGIAGVGKSTLMKKVLENVEMNIFWHRFYGFSTLRNMLTKLSIFLSKIDRKKLKNYVEGGKIDVDEVLILLEEELKGSNSMLVFDDFQKASKEITNFFEALKDLKTDMKMIVVGRAIPLFYDRRDTTVKGTVIETTLDGLDKESSKKLLRNRKIDELYHEKLYDQTKGHPLLLELITPEAREEAYQFVREGITKTLNDKERKALEKASVFRCPFYPRAIMGEDIDYDTIDDLVEKSLMQRLGDVYDLHDIIREFIYDRLTEKQKVEYHKIVAEYYQKEKGDSAVIEAMYHLVKAKKQKMAVETLLKEGSNLLNNGYANIVTGFIEELDEGQLQKNEQIELLLLKGDTYDLLGKWDRAIEQCQRALGLSEQMKDDLKKAKSYLKLGNINEEKSEWNNALASYERGLEISKRINEVKGISDGYYGMGRIHWREGELDKAISCLNKCLGYSKKINDSSVESKVFVVMGSVYGDMGGYDRAIELFSKGLVIAKRIDNKYEILRVYNNLARAYGNKKEWDKAIEYSKKQIDLAEKLGFVRMIAYGLANLSWEYIEKKDQDNARLYCERAFALFKSLNEKYMIAACYHNFANIFCLKKDWKKSIEYFDDSIKIFREINSLDGASETYFGYGKMYKEKGDTKRAKEQFKNAVKGYEKLGNKKKAEEVRKELKEIQDK